MCYEVVGPEPALLIQTLLLTHQPRVQVLPVNDLLPTGLSERQVATRNRPSYGLHSNRAVNGGSGEVEPPRHTHFNVFHFQLQSNDSIFIKEKIRRPNTRKRRFSGCLEPSEEGILRI